uniref:acyl-CoA dehydrogenase family protein n=1 Tax=Tepidiforma flava TaxID=3004094 RepID=UPI00357130F3
MLSYRVISIQAAGRVPNHEASIAKLFNTELSQRIARTAMKALGTSALLTGREAPMKGARRAATCRRSPRRLPAGRAKSSGTSSPRGGWGCRAADRRRFLLRAGPALAPGRFALGKGRGARARRSLSAVEDGLDWAS